MKSIITLITALTIWLMLGMCAQAQEIEIRHQNAEPSITAIQDKIITEEKAALKNEVETINLLLEKRSISESEAEAQKRAAADKHALNIENRIAIANNQIELAKRNEADSTYSSRTVVIINGRDGKDGNNFFGIRFQSDSTKIKKYRYDLRTFSGPVFAFGLNNVITEGESLEDTDFQIGGSRFTELGWAWNTRVFKNSNWLRVKYGFSFHFNGLKPTENRFYVDTGDQTELQEFRVNLDKSKLRIDNLVIPVIFEFGPSKKKEHDDYFRYSTYRQLKFGLGGYAGLKLSARQKLKYHEDGRKQKEKQKGDFNTNNFIYGVSGYVGIGDVSLYAKYDLNPIFKNNAVDQRNISLGLRFDFD